METKSLIKLQEGQKLHHRIIQKKITDDLRLKED